MFPIRDWPWGHGGGGHTLVVVVSAASPSTPGARPHGQSGKPWMSSAQLLGPKHGSFGISKSLMQPPSSLRCCVAPQMNPQQLPGVA